MLGEHHANGVDRFVAVEPLADQTLGDTTRRRLLSERDLRLDDGVQSGVKLFIRQANAGAAVTRMSPAMAAGVTDRLWGDW